MISLLFFIILLTILFRTICISGWLRDKFDFQVGDSISILVDLYKSVDSVLNFSLLLGSALGAFIVRVYLNLDGLRLQLTAFRLILILLFSTSDQPAAR